MELSKLIGKAQNLKLNDFSDFICHIEDLLKVFAHFIGQIKDLNSFCCHDYKSPVNVIVQQLFT